METSFRLLFWLYKSKTNKKGLAPLSLRITVGGTKTEVSTGLHIAAKQWDSKRVLIKGSSTEAKEMNKRLELLRGAANKAYNALIEQDLPTSAEQVKLKMANKEQGAQTLLGAFEYHNQLLRKKLGIEVTKATLGKYETLTKKVQRFITGNLGRKDIYLKELNHQFVVEFEVFLKTDERLSHNPAIKYIQFMKKIIHLSVANGWLPQDPFRNFKCNLITKDRGYLTMEELTAIENKPINIKRVNIVRDMFLFSCYTGLSYSDLRKLSCRHLSMKEDGSKWIVINRTKTGVRSAIPLLPRALEILDKYEPPFVPDNDAPLMPVISNQKMNAYLKELGDLCEIDKNITFHLARHTFATTITLTNGVPIESVSKMLGHTNLKTTQHYSKVVDSKVENDMKKLQEKMQEKPNRGTH